MANKTPLRAVFNASDVATGLAEFQSGDTIGLTHGGIGVSLSIGSAGQVLKVNSGASALEFGSVVAIIDIDNANNLESATLATGDKLLVSDGGTEGRATLAQLDTLFSGTTKTLTNKTINSNANTLHIDLDDLGTFTGTLAEFNSGLQGDSFVSLTGSETLTNKTLTTPTLTTPIANAGIQLKNGATSAGFLEFFEDSDNGTNKVSLIGPASTADVTVTLPAVTGTVITTANSDAATTTTSTADVDFVLVDDGGVLKKITAANLGITEGSGYTNSSFFDIPGSLANFDAAKATLATGLNTGSAESGLTENSLDAFGIKLADFDAYDFMEPKFDLKTHDLGSGEAHVGA